MPTLDDVYLKFGAVSEMAQLLETELGNIPLVSQAGELGLFQESDPKTARNLDRISRSTLGQLLRRSLALSEEIERGSELLRFAWFERCHLMFSSEGARGLIDDLCADSEFFSRADAQVGVHFADQSIRLGISDEHRQQALEEMRGRHEE